MLKYRIYIALLVGVGFTVLVFAALVSLGSDLAVGMIGITLLMPGIGLLSAFLHNCCESSLPMLVANGLIYSVTAFLFVWLLTRTQAERSLQRLTRRSTFIVVVSVALGWGTARSLEWAWSAPSDEALTRQFNHHRSELETLVSMAQKDSLVSRVANDFIWRQDSVAWPRPESELGYHRGKMERLPQTLSKCRPDSRMEQGQLRQHLFYVAHRGKCSPRSVEGICVL